MLDLRSLQCPPRSLHLPAGCWGPAARAPARLMVAQAGHRRSRRVACRDSRDPPPSGDGLEPFRHPELDASGQDSGSIPDSLPFLGSDTDWREFRAKLVASERGASQPSPSSSYQGLQGQQQEAAAWAHTLPRPEKGCLLLAHPGMFRTSQEYFYQAVILILEHSPQGSYGVILNRPSTYTLAELNLTHPLPEFDACKLYVGGDVGGGEITLLHTHADLDGASEVVHGVHTGGIHAAQDAVRGGRAAASDFRFFAKYAGWGAGQLEGECRRGVWFTAAASPGVVMAEPQLADGADRWHAVLQLMGGDYAQLSDNVRVFEERRRRQRG